MLLTSAGRMLLDRTTGLMRQIEQVRDDLQSATARPAASSRPGADRERGFCRRLRAA
jgi:DNA-binding transcriptional LysR family regulator